MDAMRRPTILQYRGFRYLKVMFGLMLLAVLAYAGTTTLVGRYLLGITSLLLTVLLMWYGIAKRRTPMNKERRERHAADHYPYPQDASNHGKSERLQGERRITPAKESWFYGGCLQGWLSAHVYLGTALIVLVSLHSGLTFSWSIHTLAYVLMMVVIGSGFFGVYAYLNYPRLITRNMGENSLEAIFRHITELDEQARIRALGFSDDINHLVLMSRQHTRIGGHLIEQLRGDQANCPTRLAVQHIHQLGQTFIHDAQSENLLELYSVLLHKERLVTQARTEIALKARMKIWLYLHVPLSVGLCAAILSHIVSVLFYW
ncbi:MAG: hypothetical protein FD135_2890 [Comamonadaceae bacterium]|nr:MAG: hypothetical protein FD135_2890 [Comamonadaceae bacterium]